MVTRGEEDLISAELFSGACSPALMPCETLYSWCARFHRLNCEWNPKLTSCLLFGHPTAGLKHDFPARLAAFHRRTKGDLGPVDELLKRHSLFGFHAPFLTAVEETLLIESLLGEGVGVPEKLGLKRTGINRVNPLKLCPECVREQTEAMGYACWKTEHQLPTAYICKAHGEWLQLVVTSQRRGALLAFHVPNERHEVERLEPLDSTAEEKRLMLRVGEWGDYFFGSPDLRLSDATLRHCYLYQAKVKDWLTFNGTVRMQLLRDGFVAKYQRIFRYFDDSFLGELDGVNAGFLAHLLRKLPGRRHPLKHILLLNLLFDNPDELVNVVKRVDATFQNGGELAVKEMLCDGHDHLLRLVTVDGHSVTRAAAMVGVSGVSATRYLETQVVELLDRRPHIIGTEKEQHLRQLLNQGMGRAEIAKTAGVRKAFIKDYLATHPELKALWVDAHRNLEQKRHRELLMTALKQHPDLPMKSIRRLPGNGFQWLYINDRDWLVNALPAIWKR